MNRSKYMCISILKLKMLASMHVLNIHNISKTSAAYGLLLPFCFGEHIPAKSSHDRQHGRLLVDASKRSTTGWLSRGVNHLGWWQESKGTATPNPLVRNFSRSKCWCRPRGSATVVKWPSCRVVVVVMNQRMRGCRDARDALDTLGEIRWLDG